MCLCVFSGVSECVSSLVRAREGGSAELGCSLRPKSKDATTPNLFPLHVVEWVRLGYNVPVLIKFGVYAPRVHPNYKGKRQSETCCVTCCKHLSFLHDASSASQTIFPQALNCSPLTNDNAPLHHMVQCSSNMVFRCGKSEIN